MRDTDPWYHYQMHARELASLRAAAHRFLKSADRSCTSQEVARQLFGPSRHEEPVAQLVVRNILADAPLVCAGHDGRWIALDAPFLARPLDTLRAVTVDLETTGSLIGVDRIIEVGFTVTDSGRAVDSFSSLVHCTRHLNGRIQRLTGIRPADLQEAPALETLAPRLMEALEKADVFVAHDVRFDQNFLRWELQRLGHDMPERPGVCTLRLAQDLWPDCEGWRLQDLAQTFDVGLDRPHRAGEDAEATAGVLLHALHDASGRGARTLADLFRGVAGYADEGEGELAARAG